MAGTNTVPVENFRKPRGMGLVVYKLGGSLLSCVDLAARLRAVIQQRSDERTLIVVGGGAAADVVRDWSGTHALTEDAAHWLALRSLSLNRALLRHLLPESLEVSSRDAAESLWSEERRLLLLDVEACLRAAAGRDRSPLPHCWEVTSDSIAAWIAARWDADELVLLKSTSLPADLTLDDATRLGLVDPFFRHLADETPRVSWCNLRDPAASVVSWLVPTQSTSGIQPGDEAVREL
jgi:5-(aminomethyl)-3-furanmethanol phosphate kinase